MSPKATKRPCPSKACTDCGSPSIPLWVVECSPSSDVLPDFVPLLHRHQVVLPEAFVSRSGRQRRALDIVTDATVRRRGGG